MSHGRLSAEAIVALDRQHVWHPYQPNDVWRDGPTPPVIRSASGVWITLDDGRRVIDGFGSWWVGLLGHGHARVRDAVHRQLDVMAHVPIAGVVHEESAALAARLAALAPAGLERVFFSDNGSTAVEVAIRAAFQFWRQNGRPERTRFVSLEGAYHGDTIGAVSVGGIGLFHEVYAELCFETVQVPSPSGEPDWSAAFEAMEQLLRAQSDTIAAVIVEPLVQGAGGMRMYAPEYLRRLRAICDELDVFLIADEVFVGLGRTGRLFACEHAGISPDFLCLSKGLSGGLFPFAATLTTQRIYNGFGGDPTRTFFYGHSYCGNPLGCAAAHAVLDTIELDDVLGNVALRAEQLRDWLASMAAVSGVRAARQCGLIGAVELSDEAGYLAGAGRVVAARALERGVWLRPLGDVIYLVPALTITHEEMTLLLERVGDAVRSAL